MSKLNLSIIVPVYNEEKTVGKTISSLVENVSTMGIDYEIIAVNDASKDKSLDVLEKFPSVKTISHSVNKGYGASLKTGIKQSLHDWIMIIDADGTYPLDYLPRLAKATDGADMVVGARDKNSAGIPLERKHAKKFLNWFAGYLAGKKIPDINSGMRLFKKEMALKYWDLFPDRFSFTSTLTMIAATKGYETVFLPIDYRKRESKSSMKPKAFFGFLKLVVKLSLFFRPIKVFGPISFIIFLGAIGIMSAFFLGLTGGKFLDTTFAILMATALQTFFFGLLAEIVTHHRR